jgi:predicted dehydrogenase
VGDGVRDRERIRVGVIGLGRAGRVHLEAWRAVSGAEVVAVADPSPAVVSAARVDGIRAMADTRELLATPGLHAVSICAPPVHHAALAIAALEHGLHVLCEKPLATRGDAALRMVKAAARTGRHLLIATKFRHVPDLLVAREIIAAGAIGEPLAFEVDFSSRVDMSARWNCRRTIAGGGVIIDNGSHAFDLVAFLLGPLASVNATRLKAGQAVAVEDSATVMVELASGLIGRVDLSWSLATQRETYVMVHGSRGTLDIGWRQSRLRVAGQETRALHAGLYDRHASHVAMMNTFVEVVRGARPPWISPVECLGAVAAVDASYRSLRSGRWVPVEPIEESDVEAAPQRMRARA